VIIEICGLKSGPGTGKHASAMNFADEVKQKGNKTNAGIYGYGGKGQESDQVHQVRRRAFKYFS
jgi:hypothetical protein